MDKIKTVKIKNEDGSISEETYTISVDARNVDMDNGKDLQYTVGTINVDTDGNISEQLNNLNEDVDSLNIDIKKKAYFFNTVAEMKAANLKNGDYACTLGYYIVNDGGAADYKIVSSTNNYKEILNKVSDLEEIVSQTLQNNIELLNVSLETGFFIYVSASVSSSDVTTACSAGTRIMTLPHFLAQTSVPLIRISCHGEPDTFILGRVIFYAYELMFFNSIPQFIE